MRSEHGDDEAVALAVVAALRRLRDLGWTVCTRGYGEVSSASAAILASGTPGFRLLDRYATVCLHLGSVDRETIAQAQVAGWARHIAACCDTYYQVLESVSGTKAECWRTRLGDGRDHWLTLQNVVELGLADRLI